MEDCTDMILHWLQIYDRRLHRHDLFLQYLDFTQNLASNSSGYSQPIIIDVTDACLTAAVNKHDTRGIASVFHTAHTELKALHTKSQHFKWISIKP